MPRSLPALGAVLLLASAIGCDKLGLAPTNDRPERERETATTQEFVQVAFDGFVYVARDDSNSKVIERVRRETQSATRSLVKRHISVADSSRVSVDLKSFVREPVKYVDPATGDRKDGVRVRFNFEGEAIAPDGTVASGAAELALLATDNITHAAQVIAECSANTQHEKDFVKTPWFVFDPTLDTCEKAVKAEQLAIDEQTAKLRASEEARTRAHPDDDTAAKVEVIPLAEFDRVYLPVKVRFLDMPNPAERRGDRTASRDGHKSTSSRTSSRGGKGRDTENDPSKPTGSKPEGDHEPDDPTMQAPKDPSLKPEQDPDTHAPKDPGANAPGESGGEHKKVPNDGFSFDPNQIGGQGLNYGLIGFAAVAAFLILRKGRNDA